LSEATTLLVQIGEFRLAARCEDDIANIYEVANEVSSAMEHCEKAAGYFHAANLVNESWRYKIKVARYAAQLGR
jgi:hypothetical protein